MKRGFIVLTILALCLAGLGAQGFSFDFKGAGMFYADAQFGYTIAEPAGLPLDAQLRLRGGYESKDFLRDATGDLLLVPSGGDGNKFESGMNGRWALGLNQALVKGEEGNLAEAFVFYRGRYDVYGSPAGLDGSVFSDVDGLFGNSFLAGLAWDSTAKDSRKVRSGLFAELSGEWAPVGMDPVGGTDFLRATFKAKGFLPLFSVGESNDESLNLVSGYLAGFASVDYATGKDVPIWVMQSFGGRDLRDSLGDCVRGYPAGSFDSSLKAVGNLEFRVNGPALFGLGWLMPIALVFVDAGYYSGFADAAADSALSGFVASAGAAVSVNILDFLQLGVKLPYRIIDQADLYGEGAASGLGSPDLMMSFHF